MPFPLIIKTTIIVRSVELTSVDHYTNKSTQKILLLLGTLKYLVFFPSHLLSNLSEDFIS